MSPAALGGAPARALDLVRPSDRAGAYFDRVLVPIDFSASSAAAFATAIRIADRWRSEVVLFHAGGPDANDEFLNSLGGTRWGRSDVVDEITQHLQTFADAIVPDSSDRVHVDATREDDPVRAVAGACARHQPSLVVLGIHGRRRRRFFRSTAERITRAIDVPVLLVS